MSHMPCQSASAPICKSEDMIEVSEIFRIGRWNPGPRIVVRPVRRKSTVATNNADYKYNPRHLFLARTRYLHQNPQRAANLPGRRAEGDIRSLVSDG